MPKPGEFPTGGLTIADQISAMTVAVQTKNEKRQEAPPTSPLPPGLDMNDQQDAMAAVRPNGEASPNPPLPAEVNSG